MKVIKNKYIPFKGFKAIMLFGIIFVRKECIFNAINYNHENIHWKQCKELLIIGFYVWYLIEWIIRLFMKGNAYYNISFEREAYKNQHYKYYLEKRKLFSFLKYLKA